jgi:hypothetical protein
MGLNRRNDDACFDGEQIDADERHTNLGMNNADDPIQYFCGQRCEHFPTCRLDLCTPRPQTRIRSQRSHQYLTYSVRRDVRGANSVFVRRTARRRERWTLGGLTFLCRAPMCCSIVGDDLMVGVPDSDVDAIVRARHVRPMDFTARPLRGFVNVSLAGFRTTAALRVWLSRGDRAARQKHLPARAHN